MLKTKIIAGPITNLTDARYFAAREVDWLLFDLDEESEYFLPERQMNAIREWVDGVKFIGAFGLVSAEQIRHAVETYRLDAVWLSTFSDAETAVELKGAATLFKEIIVEAPTTAAEVEAQFDRFASLVDYFALDFTKNGLNWETLQANKNIPAAQLSQWCARFSIMLSMDFQKEMLNSFLNVLRLAGLCVKGGVEEKIGYKSFEELDAVFDLLEM